MDAQTITEQFRARKQHIRQKTLGKKMKETIRFIVRFQHEHGRSPMDKDIAKALNIKPDTARNRIRILRNMGVISTSLVSWREIEILKVF